MDKVQAGQFKPGKPRPVIDNLSLLRAYVAVVETGSFSQAGNRLRVVPSTVSKHVAALEARLRSQLIVRSTQKLSITEIGRRFYDRALIILQEVEDAELEIGEYNSEPQGELKIAAGTVFAMRHLGPTFINFLQRYPLIKLDISLSTVSDDLIADGIDVAIRIASELAPGLIAVKLAPNVRVYCAAPSYLNRHGIPQTASELVQHNCLLIRGVPQSSRWPIKGPGGTIEQIAVSGNFVSDNGDILRQALLAGIGIGHPPLFMVYDHLKSGELVEIFPESRTVVSDVYAVYPERRNLPLKTRAFIDHLKEEFHKPLAWT